MANAAGDRQPARGPFITLEGGEGSGKSTQARALARRLEEVGLEVVLTQEPAGTPIGALVKGVFERRAAGEAPPVSGQTELLLFAAARADHVRTVIRPALEAGRTVVCDRFADSTVAYQGYGRGLPLEEIATLNRIATQGLTPDLTLLLDVPPEAGVARAEATHAAGDKARDALGEESLEFHKRVREGFLAIARAEPKRVVVIDATRSPEEVAAAVWEAVEKVRARRAGR
jgi:dTMP kinase